MCEREGEKDKGERARTRERERKERWREKGKGGESERARERERERERKRERERERASEKERARAPVCVFVCVCVCVCVRVCEREREIERERERERTHLGAELLGRLDVGGLLPKRLVDPQLVEHPREPTGEKGSVFRPHSSEFGTVKTAVGTVKTRFFQVNVLKTVEIVPSSLGSGLLLVEHAREPAGSSLVN